MDGLCDLGLEVREIFLFSACNPAMHIDVRETYAPVDSLGRLSRMNRIASAICPRKFQRTGCVIWVWK